MAKKTHKCTCGRCGNCLRHQNARQKEIIDKAFSKLPVLPASKMVGRAFDHLQELGIETSVGHPYEHSKPMRITGTRFNNVLFSIMLFGETNSSDKARVINVPTFADVYLTTIKILLKHEG